MTPAHLLGMPVASPSQAGGAAFAAAGIFNSRIERTTSGNVALPNRTADGYVYLTLCGGGGGAHFDSVPRDATNGGDSTINGTLLIAKGGKAGGWIVGDGGDGGDAVSNIPGWVFTARGAIGGSSAATYNSDGEDLYGVAFGGGRGGCGHTSQGVLCVATMSRRSASFYSPPNLKPPTNMPTLIAGGGSLDAPRYRGFDLITYNGRGGCVDQTGGAATYMYGGGGAGCFYRLPVRLTDLGSTLTLVIGAGGTRSSGLNIGVYSGEGGRFCLEWNES